MIRAIVNIRIGARRITYVAIGASTADMIIDAYDRFGACSVSARPL